jgi:hypothetical protein
MTQKRALAFGASTLGMLVSLGILGFGCAGGGEETNSSGVPCIADKEHCGDEFDNDCDGLIDAADSDCACKTGDKQACYTGPEGTKGTGSCAEGEQTCTEDGKWGACEGEVLPAAVEDCDGIDNDCNGMIDTGCACTPPVPETTQPCYAGPDGKPGPEGTEGVGECKAGTNSCKADGTWDDKCNDVVLPGDETCDALDNDCNGAVDDMGMTTCGVGACQVSVITCENGQLTQCNSLPPTKEVCDGVDNDCDQLTDENDPDNGKACDSGALGVCQPGKITCANGAKVCVSNVQSSPEACDGADNDCDGEVDDNIQGTGGGCSTGYPGVCSQGAIQCQNNVIDCFPIVAASPEICDGLDNDCDEKTDEGNPQSGAECDTGGIGACQVGTENCVSGAIVCTPNASAQAEVCDGLDNNCDGAIDENNPGGGVACGCGGTKQCQSGVLNCIGGPTTYLDEDFSDNSLGWTLGTEWAIGPAQTSSGQNFGTPDPATDHTAGTADNGLAGVVIGGNAATSLHDYYFLTSPVINLSGATNVWLKYFRQLSSDYTPYMHNKVEVFNGSSWVILWQTGGSSTNDATWTKQEFDVSAYKNANFRIRFGFNIGSGGVYTVAQWSVDDITMTSVQCP